MSETVMAWTSHLSSGGVPDFRTAHTAAKSPCSTSADGVHGFAEGVSSSPETIGMFHLFP